MTMDCCCRKGLLMKRETRTGDGRIITRIRRSGRKAHIMTTERQVCGNSITLNRKLNRQDPIIAAGLTDYGHGSMITDQYPGKKRIFRVSAMVYIQNTQQKVKLSQQVNIRTETSMESGTSNQVI